MTIREKRIRKALREAQPPSLLPPQPVEEASPRSRRTTAYHIEVGDVFVSTLTVIDILREPRKPTVYTCQCSACGAIRKRAAHDLAGSSASPCSCQRRGSGAGGAVSAGSKTIPHKPGPPIMPTVLPIGRAEPTCPVCGGRELDIDIEHWTERRLVCARCHASAGAIP